MSDQFPFLTNEYVNDPHKYWRNLRETNPIYWDDEFGFWVITQYDDIVEISKKPNVFSSKFGSAGALGQQDQNESHSDNGGVGFLPMIQNDPPEHTRIRSLFAKAFTPKRIECLAPEIQAIAQELIDEIHEKIERNEPLDLYDDFASPLPVLVIANLMGIPSTERHRLRFWSDSVGIGTGESYTLEQQAGSQREMTDYFTQAIQQRQHDSGGDDLITAMVQASEQSDQLHPEELLGLCKLLWIAGNETTTNLISNGAIFLKENPSILAKLRQDKSLIPDFTEELLRYESPVNGLFRTASDDIEYKGHQIKKGQALWLMYSSGSRDESRFPAAETFDIAREHNNHLAFGKGVHFCIGSALARLEAKIAFEWLVDLLPRMELLIAEGKRIPVPVLRGWLKIPMRVG